jgi:predicted nucleic acid-binding protein
MAKATAYLLDTNILVHLIRGKAVGLAIEAHFALRGALNRCVISVVTVGEMYALARKWNWGANKLAELQKLLSQLVWVDINHPDIPDRLRRTGRPEQPGRSFDGQERCLDSRHGKGVWRNPADDGRRLRPPAPVPHQPDTH